eukprot:TRINITY_DN41124_c0_g2_i4.p1 TRINITY_DN41124_c0_g2~~TRINITY_DN41124_c0_g2_i4.p1  ORF type:complete len:336 (-),score=48.23 TRINITY_DN41124_c0_g2_i4:615-1622(-)
MDHPISDDSQGFCKHILTRTRIESILGVSRTLGSVHLLLWPFAEVMALIPCARSFGYRCGRLVAGRSLNGGACVLRTHGGAHRLQLASQRHKFGDAVRLLRRGFASDAAVEQAKRPKRLRYVFGGVAAAVIVGCIDEGFRRCVQFWVIVLPIYAHYFWVDLVSHRKDGPRGGAEREVQFDKLHSRYSPIVERATLYMRGFYLKAAQLVSIRDDYLPPIYLEWTKGLQDEAPLVLSSEEARTVVIAELGLKDSAALDDVFADWQAEPIGTASIGQVYKARLRDTGEWVAIKVQVPQAERIFYADIKCLQLFTYFIMPWAYENLREIEKARRQQTLK